MKPLTFKIGDCFKDKEQEIYYKIVGIQNDEFGGVYILNYFIFSEATYDNRYDFEYIKNCCSIIETHDVAYADKISEIKYQKALKHAIDLLNKDYAELKENKV